MKKIVILCVEDEPEVRAALLRDLEPYEEHFRIEACEDVHDAHAAMSEITEEQDEVGLVLCDHMLPGKNGVEFLVELNTNTETELIRKVLITGQAGLEDTVRAVNEADLDHYIAKPWTSENLHTVVKEQLTDYVLATGKEVLPYVAVLEGDRLLNAMRSNTHSD